MLLTNPNPQYSVNINRNTFAGQIYDFWNQHIIYFSLYIPWFWKFVYMHHANSIRGVLVRCNMKKMPAINSTMLQSIRMTQVDTHTYFSLLLTPSRSKVMMHIVGVHSAPQKMNKAFNFVPRNKLSALSSSITHLLVLFAIKISLIWHIGGLLTPKNEAVAAIYVIWYPTSDGSGRVSWWWSWWIFYEASFLRPTRCTSGFIESR